MENKIIAGFSKLNKEEKINWLAQTFTTNPENTKQILTQYWNPSPNLQKIHEEFAENTLTNYYLPFSIAPNFLINGQIYALPMVTEESSVVAAASKAAKFWLDKGGFKTSLLGVEKLGHVHFIYKGNKQKLKKWFAEKLEPQLKKESYFLTQNMEKRGGGIKKIRLIDKTSKIEGYFQIEASFDTCDSMGANFINSCLEQFSQTLYEQLHGSINFSEDEKKTYQHVMSILSNLTPHCMARAEVICPISELRYNYTQSPEEFAQDFNRAIQIAEIDPYRAATHNKGIMNGVDSVALATGNDFRAIESCAHAYASQSTIKNNTKKQNTYTSLSHCTLENGIFRFWIDLPISIGIIGGLTQLHPLVKLGIEILQKPTAKELMGILASAGLAQNFAAISALITTGIQKGHMQMHLSNLLNQLQATDEEKRIIKSELKDSPIRISEIKNQLKKIREEKRRE